MSRQQSSIVRLGTIAICIVAGAWTIFHLIWDLGKNTADDYWGLALLVLFILALIMAFVTFFQERPALLASTPQEQFPEPSIARFFFGSAGSAALWFVLRMNVGAQWFLAGWEKVQDPTWGTSGTALKGFVTAAIAKTGGAHPSVQGWYGNFLHGLRAPECRVGLVPRDLGRGRSWARSAPGRAHGYRRRIWGADEPELSARRYGQRQSGPGHVRAVPVLLVARLRSHRPGSLAVAAAGIALETGCAVPQPEAGAPSSTVSPTTT